MKRQTNALILSALAVPLVDLLAGRWLVARRLRREVADLFLTAKTGPVKIYDPGQLVGLPAPVPRYFQHVLKPGQPYVRSARLRHHGQFKTDLKKSWTAITGKEYFLADTPGYLWIGTTTWFSACDQYIAGRGSLTARLLGVLPVVWGRGPNYDQGELLRWLAEAVWFPTSLLPGGQAVWLPVDDNSATLTLTDHGQTVSCLMILTGKVKSCTARHNATATRRTSKLGQGDSQTIARFTVSGSPSTPVPPG